MGAGVKITKAIYEAMRKKAAEEKLKASKNIAREAAEKSASRLKSKKYRDKKAKGVDPASNIKSPKFTGPKPKSKTYETQEAKRKASEGQNIFKKTLGNRSTPDAKAKALLKKDRAALIKEYGTTRKDLIERIKEGRKYRAEQQSVKDAKAKKAGTYNPTSKPGRKAGDSEAWAGWGRYGKAGKPINKKSGGSVKMEKGGKIKKGYHKMPDGRIMKDSAHKGMKKGGKVSSCSKRGDGCAVRGKTKGRMI
jgi:hypothetical protein